MTDTDTSLRCAASRSFCISLSVASGCTSRRTSIYYGTVSIQKLQVAKLVLTSQSLSSIRRGDPVFLGGRHRAPCTRFVSVHFCTDLLPYPESHSRCLVLYSRWDMSQTSSFLRYGMCRRFLAIMKRVTESLSGCMIWMIYDRAWRHDEEGREERLPERSCGLLRNRARYICSTIMR
jgi:hypothetical protein